MSAGLPVPANIPLATVTGDWLDSPLLLVNNTSHPRIAEDYEKTFKVLKSLPCDIFPAAHGNYFGLETKYPRLKDEGLSVFVDPEGHKKYVEDKEQEFKTELAKQKTAHP